MKKSNIYKEKLQNDTQHNEKPRECTEIRKYFKSNSELKNSTKIVEVWNFTECDNK